MVSERRRAVAALVEEIKCAVDEERELVNDLILDDVDFIVLEEELAATASLDALLAPLATDGLRLVDGRRQTFATRRARRGADVDVTFARWLVTWERVVDAAS